MKRIFTILIAPLFACLILAASVRAENQSASIESQNERAKLASIQLSAERRQLIGVTTSTVEYKDIVDRIETSGTVETDEQLQSYVQTRFGGWIRRVYADQTFQHVSKGQPLFTIYAPELASAENEYLLSAKSARAFAPSGVDSVASGAQSLADAALDRLRLFGVPEREIARLKREGTARNEVEIDSPATGYITDRQAFPNMSVQPDARLYTIADLSKVWVYAAVFQDQIATMKVGDPVEITIDSYPGKVFPGKIDFIWGALDPMTRTAKVRCNLANPEGRFKLGMFVNVALERKLGRSLAIPDSGVLRTGTRNVVFIDRGDGYLTPIDVQLGAHAGGEFAVTSGLKAGDRIVTSANFLIDSESQLQAAMGAFTPVSQTQNGAASQAANQSATIEITTSPTPPLRGDNQIEVRLADASGKPISGADVSIVFYMPAMPAMGMSAMRVQANAKEHGNGRYQGSIKLDSGGTWTVTIAATKGGQTIASRQLDVNATGSM
ncbi:MAG TPA: FixH family protein [Candidatus Binataceae bacterium]|nr:FixH family protein [Candidatus Binataceae bacterium]